MTDKELGAAFRHLRLQKKWTLETMAEQLKSVGSRVKSRTGVFRLEERGSSRRLILEDYEAVFKTDSAEILKLAESLSAENNFQIVTK